MAENKTKALVVDDEKIVRDFLVRLLTLQKLEVVTAESGERAIEIIKNNKFDLYFLDVRMPGIDGLETYRSIRKIDPNAVVVMMTGYAAEDVLERAQAEGAHSAIRKPFNIAEIKGIIDNIGQEGDKESLNILVVDDDPSVLDFFSRLLNNKNHRFRLAYNKDEVLSAVQKEKFDLVFLDLIFKDISGAELYKEIKQVLPEVNIVMMTGYPQKAKEMEGAISVDGCFYKPFAIDGIIEYLDKAKAKIKA